MRTAMRIRRVHSDDASALRDFYGRLSAQSRLQRFLGSGAGLSTSQSLTFCTPDHVHAEGFVAISDRPADRGAILGHLCLEPVDDGQLELALAVADAEQNRGIGRALFTAALDWATASRYESIAASCFAGNSYVLRLLSSATNGCVIKSDGAGVVDVTLLLRSTAKATAQAARKLAA